MNIIEDTEVKEKDIVLTDLTLKPIVNKKININFHRIIQYMLKMKETASISTLFDN